jgi:hypothetical protein
MVNMMLSSKKQTINHKQLKQFLMDLIEYGYSSSIKELDLANEKIKKDKLLKDIAGHPFCKIITV